MKQLISSFKIPAANFNRAVDFYRRVLGIELIVCETDVNDEQLALFPVANGYSIGAILYSGKPDYSIEGIQMSIYTDDMDETLDLVQSNGGLIIRPKSEINGNSQGYYSAFIDSEGNQVGLYSNK